MVVELCNTVHPAKYTFPVQDMDLMGPLKSR